MLYAATAGAANSSISRALPTKNTSANQETVTVKNRSAANASRNVTRGTNAKESNSSRSVRSRAKNTSATFESVVNTSGRNARVESASLNANPAVRRAGVTLRPSTAEVGGRATIGNTGVQTGSNIDEQVRGVKTRASIFGSVNRQKTVTAESLAEAKDIMEKTSDLNSACQQQYNECMDQFCAVVDANQQRCSCSANLSKYASAQEAVEKANIELNDVAQQIRYVGLSADEIRAIMSATEAELEMNKTKDNTKTRSILDDIADMIKDPTAATSLTASSSNSLLDLEFDFSGESDDLLNLDIFGSSTSSDISSKRGTALYNEAKKRCKTVLNRCKDAGGTENQISGNYDLAIAKDCIAYEQGLEKLNQKLINNVRSAKLMLQKARLAVLQNNNEYDAKECIGALENCMLDDMVCGENYVKCLDPTKKYIDENGNVVLGRNLPNITNMMTEYNNTSITTDFIKASINDTTCPNHDGACIVNYLMSKIGTGQSVKDGGLCRAVLDKCRYYTYETNNKKSTYKPYNEVVVNYIQRAMVNIKAAQSKIISDYASTCMADVEACYNQQNTQIASWTSSANINNIYRVMKGACYNVALTCGYAVFAYDKEMGNDMCGLAGDVGITAITNDENVNWSHDICIHEVGNNKTYYDLTSASTQQKNSLQTKTSALLIESISQMFYESLFCPEHSSFSNLSGEISTNRTMGGWVNTKCKCNAGYTVWNGTCVTSCSTQEYRDETGFCNTCAANEVLAYNDTTDQSVRIEYGKCVSTSGGEGTSGTNNTNSGTGGNSAGSSGSNTGSGGGSTSSGGNDLGFGENPYSGGNSPSIYEEPGNNVRP